MSDGRPSDSKKFGAEGCPPGIGPPETDRREFGLQIAGWIWGACLAIFRPGSKRQLRTASRPSRGGLFVPVCSYHELTVSSGKYSYRKMAAKKPLIFRKTPRCSSLA